MMADPAAPATLCERLMPDRAVAVIVPSFSIVMLPAWLVLEKMPVPPIRLPALVTLTLPPLRALALMPSAWLPLVAPVVEEVAPVVTVTLPVPKLWALMPELPELKISPAEVVTLTLPASLLNAWIAKMELPVIVALAPTLIAISPVPRLDPLVAWFSPNAAMPYC